MLGTQCAQEPTLDLLEACLPYLRLPAKSLSLHNVIVQIESIVDSSSP